LFAEKFYANLYLFSAANGFQKPQENITYEGFSWEPKFAGKSAGNVFPANFWSKTAGKSAGNK
jgi:hypothetical protein